MGSNPYKRLRELTRTSQKDFAAKYGFSKTTMTFIESGQVVTLSDRMIVALGQECFEQHIDAKATLRDEFTSPDLQTAYQNWKTFERLSVAHLFQTPVTPSLANPKSPFSIYVHDVAGSEQRFCKMLKVPAAAVQLYAKGSILTMPRALDDALTQIRFAYLKELKGIQNDWLFSVALVKLGEKRA